jgi:hypothetical protein
MNTLTQEMVCAMFDYREDGNLVRRYATMGNGNYAGRVIGTKPKGTRSSRYSTTKINGNHWCVHKLIYLHQHGVVPDQLDHINMDSSDNRIENLRVATSSENACNRKLFSSNTSGCKGVSWHKRQARWFAYVDVGNKRKSIGYFDDIESANLAATKARDLYHGLYANHV